MYKDMYNDYSDVHFEYDYPRSFANESEDYLVNNNKPTYEMDYGDTTVIPFRIDEKYWGCCINIMVTNFRYEEVIFQQVCVDEQGIAYLDIDYETSKNILKKGLYHCQLQAVGLDEHELIQVITIQKPNECTIYVR